MTMVKKTKSIKQNKNPQNNLFSQVRTLLSLNNFRGKEDAFFNKVFNTWDNLWSFFKKVLKRNIKK